MHLIIFVLSLFPLFSKADVFRPHEISVLEINSAITPATHDYLKYQFSKTPEKALILIKMNTPGGLITTTKDIITLVGGQKNPIAVWITPEGASASSAGAIIAASAHFILMTPGTNIGAATPVGLGGDLKESDGRSKALNDLTSLVRSLSESRQRPGKPFEDMIKTAQSFTDTESHKLGIINGVISRESEVIDVLHHQKFILQGQEMKLELNHSPPVKNYAPTLGQTLLEVLANPATAYFIFLAGIALIYFELQAPGGYIAGGIGVCLLILSAISFQVLPLNWGALSLIIIGAVLLILEIYITSYGLLALGGIASFVAGSLFLFHGEGGFISIDYPVLISTFFGILTACSLIAWYLIREHKKQEVTGNFFLPTGSKGTILKELNNDDENFYYQVKVRGEIWNAFSHEKLTTGDSVEITNILSNQLLAQIKKINKE